MVSERFVRSIKILIGKGKEEIKTIFNIPIFI